jgi:putative transposase
MVRFTTLRWSNIFTENANIVLTGLLRYQKLETSLRTAFEIGFSEALDPHVNKRRFTEEWWA